MKLIDIGEREIIASIISKYCNQPIGDDCAELNVTSGAIIVTMDPVPPPAAEILGGDSDPYWKGWLLTVINASDLAAAAARPLAFFVGIDAKADMEAKDLERFFQGIADCCRKEGLIYAGGNIREASYFSAIGTAIGTRSERFSLNRRGAVADHYIGVVGQGGQFWHDAIRASKGRLPPSKFGSPLFAPSSQSFAMRLLGEAGVLSCAMDNSDGLLSTVRQISSQNGLGAMIDLGSFTPPSNFDADELDICFQRFWLGWGDWNVVVGFKPEHYVSILNLSKDNGFTFTKIGAFTESTDLLLEYNGEISQAPRIESERFTKDSWFSAGIEGYIEILLTSKLPGDL